MAGLRLNKPSKQFSTGSTLLDSVLGLEEFDPLSLVSPMGIALGPYTGMRKLAPGTLLKLRELAEAVVAEIGLPKGSKAFLGGGAARGFGRAKRGGFKEADPSLFDLDLILGIPKSEEPWLRKQFESLIGLSSGGQSMQDMLRALGTNLRTARVPYGGEKRMIHGLDVGGHPVDVLAELLENVGKGFTGFDPVINLPLRRK